MRPKSDGTPLDKHGPLKLGCRVDLARIGQTDLHAGVIHALHHCLLAEDAQVARFRVDRRLNDSGVVGVVAPIGVYQGFFDGTQNDGPR